MIQEQFFYFRALQGHSGRNLIDPLSQDNADNLAWVIPTHLPHRMCF